MKFQNQTNFYRGKVRDVMTINDDILVMIVSNRISAFDVILPREIPYKGQVLNQIAHYHLNRTRDIVKNWLITSPLPNITIGKKCEPLKVEMVVRGYLTGHALRTYRAGSRILCGVELPNGLKQNQKFESPIITPTTKADIGHDIDISGDEIIKRGIVSKEHYEQLEKYSLQLFERGSKIASERGLILVDTKYEFGLLNDEIILIDEIHTPDSSRYFIKDSYDECFSRGVEPKQLSKEFVRQWLIENGFSGGDGQIIPEMTDSLVNSISERYIELYELITSEKFQKWEPLPDLVVEDIINKNISEI